MIRVTRAHVVPCAAALVTLASLSACNTSERRIAARPTIQSDPIDALLALEPPSSTAPVQADLLHTNPDAALGVLAARPDPRAAARPANQAQAAREVSIFGDLDHPDLIATDELSAIGSVENLKQVSFSREGSDFDPEISPDGQFVYFSSTAHTTTSDIMVKRVDGTALTQLTTDPAMDIMPAISPDGTRIAFVSNRSGSWDIYIMSAAGGQPIQLTNDPAQELHPTWSADSSTIAFCRLGLTSGSWEIWTTQPDRPASNRFLTYGLFPDWHPRLNKIVFQRSRQRGDRLFSVWTVDLVQGEAVQPTIIASSNSTAIINPRWSPDGDFIAVATVKTGPAGTTATHRPDRADVWILKADGTSRARLTDGRAVNLMPTWGPDEHVYFVSNRNGSDNIWARAVHQAIASGAAATGSRSRHSTPNNHDSSQTAEFANVPADINDRH